MRRSVIKAALLLLLMSAIASAASVRNQILLMEASENIRLESQKVVKNYLYYYNNPRKAHFKEMALRGLADLDKQFRLIAKTTKDEDSKDVLAFLDYSKEKMEEVLKDPFNKDNPALMLDYSEILLEGAESIGNDIEYVPSEEEKKLMKLKELSFLIAQMTKYYVAIIVEGSGINYAEMLEESIKKMEKSLSLVDNYGYSDENLAHLNELKKDWKVLKKFYLSYKEIKVPNIVLLASSRVKSDAHVLELYHSKNL